jgi:outer membrane protein
MSIWRQITRHMALPMLVLAYERPGLAQQAPTSPEHPWRYSAEQRPRDAGGFSQSASFVPAGKTYSLAELVDLAEAHNPETRAAWELARAQAAALGVARSELFPVLAVIASSQTLRREAFFGSQFTPQTIQALDATFALSYTVFDFGGRAGRIDAARAQALGSNFAFNDAHRRVIFSVEQAYYRLLNSQGQQEAARASLANSEAVQQAAEERLKHGLATLPDVLEARSATAQARFDLQVTLGAGRVAGGDLATAIGVSPSAAIRVEAISDLPIPESIGQTVEAAIERGFRQRPDLMGTLADIQAAAGKVKDARSRFYPTLTFNATPTPQSLFGFQGGYSTGHASDLAGQANLALSWTVFEGGASKSNFEETKAGLRAAQAKAQVVHDRIANEIWAAYADFETAIGQRQAATALLEAAGQSYSAAVESYNYGVRTLLDVTNAQRILAQARLADVIARTQVLTTLSDLAYAAGDSVEPGARRSGQ